MLELFIEARVLSKIKKLNNVICYVQKQKTRADIILIARVSISNVLSFASLQQCDVLHHNTFSSYGSPSLLVILTDFPVP